MDFEEPSKTDWAWLAGIIDGEGTFSIYKKKRSYNTTRGGQKKYTEMNPKLSIGNTNEFIIAAAQSIIGAVGISIRCNDAPSRRRNNQRPIFYLQVQRQETLLRVLKGTLPYLIGKRQEAVILLQFVIHRQGRGRNSAYSWEEYQMYERIHQEIHSKTNKRHVEV